MKTTINYKHEHMKEIKAFLSNQKDIYTVMLLEEMKSESPNFVAMRDILNMVIANEITLQGIKKNKDGK